jgi:hypothetical protein
MNLKLMTSGARCWLGIPSLNPRMTWQALAAGPADAAAATPPQRSPPPATYGPTRPKRDMALSDDESDANKQFVESTGAVGWPVRTREGVGT